uniref:Glucosidase II beta subunit N-terminal domain-containing protein n=1 Tax=Anopheles dirus TaxID=7168 RepID=A0A182NCC0_9DIPT
MRKTWVKRDNIYYKPFYKQKLKVTLIGVIAMGILFFVYQLVYISQLLPLQTVQAGPKTRPLKANSNDNPIASLEPVGRDENNQHEYGHQNAGQERGKSILMNGTTANKPSIWSDTQFAYVEKIGNYERKILRGIRLADIQHYNENSNTRTFRCLASNKEIPWTWVNDDYCDCVEDGSDEPGTGACNNGRFYCRFQKRHKTGRGIDHFVPSGWINDGVCDCCDGSDEWLTKMKTNSGSLCPNVCKIKYYL